MKFDWRNNRDFFSGLHFIAWGAAAIIISRDYPMGSALRMGPGYFPTGLGLILVAFGIYVMIQGLRNNEKVQGNWSPRALIMLPVAAVVYGYMVDRVGFIPSLLVLVILSAAAGREFKILEVLVIAAGLTAMAVVIFIWGLNMPYPLWKWGM